MVKSFLAEPVSIPEIVGFIGSNMESKGFNKNLVREYKLLVEEIAIKLVNNAKDSSEITVNTKRKLGSYNIVIGCAGHTVILESEDEYDYGGLIIEEYGDYLRQSYSDGVNYVTLAFSTSSNQTLFWSTIALILSGIVAFPMLMFCTPEQMSWLDDSIVRPIVSFFVRCLQTMSMPTAFFSLACMIVNIRMYLSSEVRLKRYFVRCIITSLCAIGIGILFWRLYDSFGLIKQLSGFITNASEMFGNSVEGFLMKLISSNIIEPFVLDNPIPMLILAILMGIAVGNIFGPEGEFARKSIRSINSVFVAMLNIIYELVPFFLFFALLASWIHYGTGFFLYIFKLIFKFVPALMTLFVLYMMHLLLSGINPIRFIVEFNDVIWNNLKIGSNIEALPYNKRMIFRKRKINRNILHKELKLGSMVNMDGNCIMLSLGILVMVSSVGITLSVQQLIAISLIIILLGVGIPNQPGSFLLGMIVLMTYIGISHQLYVDILVAEAFLSKLYSFANSIGDVVAVVSNDNVIKSRKK